MKENPEIKALKNLDFGFIYGAKDPLAARYRDAI